MKKLHIAALSVALIAFGSSTVAWSEDDDDDERGRKGKTEHSERGGRGGLGAVTNERYRTECGGCHFAYLPGLLPAASWGQVMDTLDKHFGDDATLEPAVKDELLAYLQTNAADRGAKGKTRFTAPPAGKEPPRITQTAYFTRKHDEVPGRQVKDNPKVGSFSNCQACHPKADKGSFEEDDVVIPGFGAFKD